MHTVAIRLHWESIPGPPNVHTLSSHHTQKPGCVTLWHCHRRRQACDGQLPQNSKLNPALVTVLPIKGNTSVEATIIHSHSADDKSAIRLQLVPGRRDQLPISLPLDGGGREAFSTAGQPDPLARTGIHHPWLSPIQTQPAGRPEVWGRDNPWAPSFCSRVPRTMARVWVPGLREPPWLGLGQHWHVTPCYSKLDFLGVMAWSVAATAIGTSILWPQGADDEGAI